MKSITKRILTCFFALILSFSAITFTDVINLPVKAASSATISIKKSPILKSSSIKTSSVTLKWAKTKGATSYKIYRSTNKTKWTLIKTTKSTSYTATKLTTGKKYYFRLRAYKNGTKSPFSKIITVTPKPNKVTGLKTASKSWNSIKISWKKVSGATGYKVYRYNSTTKKHIELKNTTKTSYTVKNLKVGTSYQFRVKAYKKSNKKNVYGELSAKHKTSTSAAVSLINKTVGTVKNVYGNKYYFTALTGSSVMCYKNQKLVFYLDGFYEKPTSSKKIKYISSYGTTKILGNLHGKMNYSQIVSAVGNKQKVGTPTYYYNEMDGIWSYSLHFRYKGYNISYTWSANPKTTKSDNLFVSKIENITDPRDLIKIYDDYLDYGICCNYMEVDGSDLYNRITADQSSWACGFLESTCCHNLYQAKEHIKEYLSNSLIQKLYEDHFLEYNGSLYAIYGGMGRSLHNYNTLKVKKLSNGNVIITADLLSSGDEYCGTDKFVIKKKNNKYYIHSVTQIK